MPSYNLQLWVYCVVLQNVVYYQTKFVQQTLISLWQLARRQSEVTFSPILSQAPFLTHPKKAGADAVGSYFLVYSERSFPPTTPC